MYYFWMQCGCGGTSHVHKTFSCSEFNVSPTSSVSLPNLQVIFGSVVSSVLRNFDATISLDSATSNKKVWKWKRINIFAILTAAPGNRAASCIFVINGNASARNAVAIMELNVAIDLAAVWIVHNSSVIETSLAYARMTFMAVWIHCLALHILLTVKVAFCLWDFVNFLFICAPVNEWKWKTFSNAETIRVSQMTLIEFLPHSYLAQHCPTAIWRTQDAATWWNKSGHSIFAQLKSTLPPTSRQRHAAEHLGCSSSGTSSPTLYDLPLLWHLPSLGISGHSTLETK